MKHLEEIVIEKAEMALRLGHYTYCCIYKCRCVEVYYRDCYPIFMPNVPLKELTMEMVRYRVFFDRNGLVLKLE